MPRIVGIDIPKEKKIEVALTYIYGIGPTVAKRILKDAGVTEGRKADSLDDQEVSAITRVIQEKYQVEGDLRRLQAANVKRLIGIGTYRGYRHKRSLPARGQRTRTNARTRKGPKKTIGAFKDKAMRKPAGPAA